MGNNTLSPEQTIHSITISFLLILFWHYTSSWSLQFFYYFVLVRLEFVNLQFTLTTNLTAIRSFKNCFFLWKMMFISDCWNSFCTKTMFCQKLKWQFSYFVSKFQFSRIHNVFTVLHHQWNWCRERRLAMDDVATSSRFLSLIFLLCFFVGGGLSLYLVFHSKKHVFAGYYSGKVLYIKNHLVKLMNEGVHDNNPNWYDQFHLTPVISVQIKCVEWTSFEFFVFNTNLTFLYKIDIEDFEK